MNKSEREANDSLNLSALLLYKKTALAQSFALKCKKY